MMPLEDPKLAKKRLERFVIESVRLDALLDARAKDIDFVRAGGNVFYSPDQSTWSAFFFPVQHGQEHSGSKNHSIDGFAEVYLESDRSDEPFLSPSPLSKKQVTGMLGKVLMDTIFSQQHGIDIAPDFFLTEESKTGLNQAIETLLSSRENNSKNIRVQERLNSALKSLQKEFHSTANAEELSDLFVRSPQSLAKGGMMNALLDDENLINLTERSKLYNEIGFFDWDYIKSHVDNGESDETTFHFGKSEIQEFERLKAEFTTIFEARIPQARQSKIPSISEILALNYVVKRTNSEKTKFVYLTNSKWAIRDFDGFEWDETSQTPLKPSRGSSRSNSVSSLFVRNPLCFLHDIELRPGFGDSKSVLKTFMDSIVPKKLHDERRLDTSDSKRKLIRYSLNELTDDQIRLYLRELESFFAGWSQKKVPWVNSFLRQRGKHWSDGLELFSKEGFHGFWRQVNRDFARQAWQFGIYLALMTEDHPARAAPLVFIDCDEDTNEMLLSMQATLARYDIEGFQSQLHNFADRPVGHESDERRAYFDSLVNAVLFMFSSQFGTSHQHAETACDLATITNDPEITGREAYYLRSHLIRVMAQNRSEFEMARKLMLIARSKLQEDNAKLLDSMRISSVRFDIEDWSRKIVENLAAQWDKGNSRQFPPAILQEYLSFVRSFVRGDFSDLRAAERVSLLDPICERLKFNFLVLAITLDESNGLRNGNRTHFLAELVETWNQSFGKIHGALEIYVDEEEVKHVSTMEKVYLIALVSGAPDSGFISKDFDVSTAVKEFFDTKSGKEAIKSARSSFVDADRFRSLKKYCKERV